MLSSGSVTHPVIICPASSKRNQSNAGCPAAVFAYGFSTAAQVFLYALPEASLKLHLSPVCFQFPFTTYDGKPALGVVLPLEFVTVTLWEEPPPPPEPPELPPELWA